MKSELLWFFLLLLANFIIVLIYMLWNLIRSRTKHKQRSKSMWFRIGVMLLFPVVGILFFLFGYLLYKILFSAKIV